MTVNADLQIRPALRPGLVVAPMGQGLLVEGGVRRHLLKGQALQPVLPVVRHLLPLLDGQHDRGHICAEVGLERTSLDCFLALLADCNALEPGGRTLSAAGEGPPAHVTTFLSCAAETVAGRGPEQAAVLAESSVVIAAPRAISDLICADLSETGLGSVLIAKDMDLHSISASSLRKASSAARGIVAIYDDTQLTDRSGRLGESVARCSEYSLSVLRFASGPALEIGPVFNGAGTACVRCFEQGYAAMSWPRPVAPGGTSATVASGPCIHNNMLAALVTSEVLGLICGIGLPAPPRMLTRTLLPRHRVERYDVTPEPDCTACGGWRAAHGLVGMVESYEWLERREPDAKDGRSSQHSTAELRNISASLARRNRVTPGPRVSLAEGAELPDMTIPLILKRTAGWRPSGVAGSSLRFDPSAGEIPSVHTYLICPEGLLGSNATVFRYDSLIQELVATRAAPAALAWALTGTDLDPATLQFALVLVAAVGQLRQRFGTLAVRLSHLDAGCAATDLAIAAAGLGRRVSFASRWTRDPAELLELDPEREIVAAIAGFHGEQELWECR